MKISRLAIAVLAATLAAAGRAADDPDADLRLSFTVSELIVQSDKRPTVTFSGPAVPRSGERYWITVVKTGSADSDWGDWQFVEDGATAAELEPQVEGGSYEIRLLARYPTEPARVICRQRIMVEPSRAASGINDLRASFVALKQNWAAGEAPMVKFNAPLSPRPGEQYRMTMVKAGAQDRESGISQFLEAGATEATLPVPAAGGAHEIRLFARYPTENARVICRAMVMVEASRAAVGDNDLRATFRPAKFVLRTNESAQVTFNAPLAPRPGEQYWITIVPAGRPDSEWGAWQYANPGAAKATLRGMPKAGAHEIRLHARYPTEQFKVVHRVGVEVK